MAAPHRSGYFHSLPLIASLSLLLHVPVALGQGKQPSDFIWQLQDIDLYRPTGNPSLGRQNFTWCCIKAVQEAVEVQADQLVLRPGYEDWIILDNGDGNITDLVNYSDSSLFPCTAVYSPGDYNGAPIVQVPYTWLADVCPGWQISDKTNLNGWLQPLSGFLLPAVIFCLSVPRRRKLRVPRALFSPELSRMSSYFVVIPNANLAGLMVCFDTIIWLCICFALAGPMILSGLYEALLDNRVLDFVKEKVDNRRLTLDMRCRLLMIILIGNLDLALDQPVMTKSICGASEGQTDQESSCDTHTDLIGERQAQGIELQNPYGTDRHVSRSSQLSPTVNSRANSTDDNHRSSAEQSAATLPQGTGDLPASPWWHMEQLLYDIRLYDADSHMQPFSPAQGNKCMDENGGEIRCPHRDNPRPLRRRDEDVERHVLQMKTRLRTMLHCQYSFGSIVGAPVVFFLGGFVFALLQSLDVIGDEDVALGLAFGQWYMTIPHIAIISGLLLAGNNPNILEGVLATVNGESEDDKVSFLGIKFELAYPSCYKVAWQWRRGPTKRRWIKQLLKTYHTTIHEKGPDGINEDMNVLKAKTTLTSLDWFVILGLALVLMGVPYTLAFLTAFFTPEIGLSCRSLTITIYAAVQFAHILLWLWANAGPPAKRKKSASILNFFCEGGWLDENGFYNPASVTKFMGHSPKFTWHALVKGIRSPEFRSVSSVWCVIWYFLYSVLCAIAVLAALGGTLMQLIGVYSADICQVTVGSWFLPFEQRPIVVISVNTAQMIHTALVFWVPCAVTAIIFMTLVSFIAWWYQRRMRDMFGELVRTIDLPLHDRDDTMMARMEDRAI